MKTYSLLSGVTCVFIFSALCLISISFSFAESGDSSYKDPACENEQSISVDNAEETLDDYSENEESILVDNAEETLDDYSENNTTSNQQEINIISSDHIPMGLNYHMKEEGEE